MKTPNVISLAIAVLVATAQLVWACPYCDSDIGREAPHPARSPRYRNEWSSAVGLDLSRVGRGYDPGGMVFDRLRTIEGGST